MVRTILIAILFSCVVIGKSEAEQLIGVFATPNVMSNPQVRSLVERRLGPVGENWAGTELTPVYTAAIVQNPDLEYALSSLNAELDSAGYAILVSRFEHDIVAVNLLNGTSGYAVRVYITLVADFFASRAAFSTESRLESVHSIPLVIGRLFPDGELLSARPSVEQLNAIYETAFSDLFYRLTAQIERDTQFSRRRSTRLFEVAPVGISDAAQEFMASLVGAQPDSMEWHSFEQELAYLMHSAILDELATNGIGNVAVAPPTTNWSIANVAQELDAQIGGQNELSVGAASSASGMIIRAEISRAATLAGEGNAIGRQLFAASEVRGSIFSSIDGASRPQALPEDERSVSARGAGGFISLVGVNDPPIRGMWREGYLDALEDFVPEIVEKMILTSEEIR